MQTLNGESTKHSLNRQKIVSGSSFFLGDCGSKFEPKIVGFLCNWCAYAGADLAGMSRIHYPHNIRIIRVMCSGRIHLAFVLEAFRLGADGVLVAGCHPGDCHYVTGNLKAQRRIIMLKALLRELGIEPERLKLEWVSASEGEKFARVISEMVEELKKLGPSPLNETYAGYIRVDATKIINKLM